jgi:hypothetical protein
MNRKVGSRGGRRAVPTEGETDVHNTTAYQKARLVVKTISVRYISGRPAQGAGGDDIAFYVEAGAGRSPALRGAGMNRDRRAALSPARVVAEVCVEVKKSFS